MHRPQIENDIGLGPIASTGNLSKTDRGSEQGGKQQEELHQANVETAEIEACNLVAWDGPQDTGNPKNWSMKTKIACTLTISTTGLASIMMSSMMAPALPLIGGELHMDAFVQPEMALSVYVLAIAFGPLVLSPLSERFGRAPILHGANVWFSVWNLTCGFATSKGLLIAARFLTGLGASVGYAIGPGVLGDIWRPEQRGFSLGLYALMSLLGSAIGPIVGGYITENVDWRWMFGFSSIFGIILVLFELEAENNPTTLQQNLARPLKLFFKDPIIPIIALYMAFNFGVLFLVLATFATLWTDQYKWSISSRGLYYIALVVGEVTAAQLGARIQDRIWRHLKKRAGGEVNPEYRVPLMYPGAILVPIGIFWYGWSAQAHLHFLMPDIGIAIFGFGTMIATQAMHAYLVDAYGQYAASAAAASSWLQCLAAFTFPLFATRLYQTLGYGVANSVLAGGALALGVPIPVLLWRYGSVLRKKGKLS